MVIWEISQIAGIWELSQMSGYLGTFPDVWVSGNFPRCLVIWEISNIFDGDPPQITIGIWVIWEISQITMELSQMPGNLGNFQYF